MSKHDNNTADASFNAYRDAIMAQRAQAKRDEQAASILNGSTKIMGNDSKGRSVQLGTPALRLRR